VRGVSDDQRYVVLLAVRDCTLGVKLVRAVHVAMIGGQDHDRLVGLTRGVQRGENGLDVAIHIAHAIQIIVVAPAPAGVLVRDVADQRVVGPQEITMRRRAARSVKCLKVACRELEVPLLGIERIDRVARDALDAAFCLDLRAGGHRCCSTLHHAG
jgi:hypothetical protein